MQFLEIKDVRSSLTENPNGIYTGVIAFFSPPNKNRYNFLNMTNIDFYDRVNDALTGFVLHGYYNADMTMKNMNFTNSQFQFRSITAELVINLVIDGLYYDNISVDNGRMLLNLENPISLSLNDLVFINSSMTSTVPDWIEFIGTNSQANISNIHIENIVSYTTPIIMFSGSWLQLEAKNISVKSSSVDSDTSLIYLPVTTLNIDGIHFENIEGHSQDSTNNFMIELSSIDLSNEEDLVIQNMTVSNSTIGILNIAMLTGETNSGKTLTVKDVYVSNCIFENNLNLFELSQLQSQQNFTLIYSTMVFTEIEFVQGGNLITFEHLLANPVYLQNSSFTEIKGGQISVESSAPSSDNASTSVIIEDFYANNINAYYGSLFILQNFANLTIENSDFSNINSFERGSVLYAGTESTTTLIKDTTFFNNSAIIGGVMLAERESKVE